MGGMNDDVPDTDLMQDATGLEDQLPPAEAACEICGAKATLCFHRNPDIGLFALRYFCSTHGQEYLETKYLPTGAVGP